MKRPTSGVGTPHARRRVHIRDTDFPKKSKLVVFVGWSEHDRISEPAAQALVLFLEQMLGEHVEAWTARFDLEKGIKWFDAVVNAALRSDVGIFCITEKNHLARWMAFEGGLIIGAGIAKQSHRDSSAWRRMLVIPLLIGSNQQNLMEKSPFGAFQSCLCTEEEMKYLIRQLGTRLRRTPHIGEKFDRHFSNAWKGFVMAVGEAAAKAKAQADEQEAEAVPKKIEDAFHALTDLADKIIEAIPGRRSPPEPDLTELRRWLVDTLSAHDSANIQVAKVLAQLSSRTPGASRSAELMAKNVEIAESDLQRMVDEAQSQLKQLEQKWNQ